MANVAVIVSELPICDVCNGEGAKVPAYADARIKALGCWGNVCRPCFDKFGCKLGLGMGQKLLTTNMADEIVARRIRTVSAFVVDSTGTISAYSGGKLIASPLNTSSFAWAMKVAAECGIKPDSWRPVDDVPGTKFVEVQSAASDTMMKKFGAICMAYAKAYRASMVQ